MFGTIETITTTAPPQTVAPSGFQNALQNINNVLTNVVKPAADIYTQVKPGSSGSSSTSPTYTPTVTAPVTTPAPAESNTKKYVLIGGAVVLGALGIYFVTRKKKGKK